MIRLVVNFLKIFLKLADPNPDSISSLSIVEKLLDNTVKKPATIYFKTSNSELFSLIFLLLLDKKHRPALGEAFENDFKNEVNYFLDEKFNLTFNSEYKSDRFSKFENSFLGLTSGTSGQQKVLEFDIERTKVNALMHAESLNITESSCLFQVTSMMHVFAIVVYIFVPIIVRCKIKFDFNLMNFPHIKEKNSAILHITPYQESYFHQIKKSNINFKVNTISVGAGSCTKEFAHKLLNDFCDNLFVTYGLSEAGPRVTSGKVNIETYETGWIGYPLTNVSIFPNKFGENMPHCKIKTPTFAINVNCASDQYFSTADYISFDEQRGYFFHGRSSDLLRIRGRNTLKQSIESKFFEECKNFKSVYIHQKMDDSFLIFIENDQNNNEQVEAAKKTFIRILARPQSISFRCIRKFPRTLLGKIDVQNLLKSANE